MLESQICQKMSRKDFEFDNVFQFTAKLLIIKTWLEVDARIHYGGPAEHKDMKSQKIV